MLAERQMDRLTDNRTVLVRRQADVARQVGVVLLDRDVRGIRRLRVGAAR